MTQEEKQLLLKDLCARLPYGVICKAFITSLQTDTPPEEVTLKLTSGMLTHLWIGCRNLKPYLRPMSSMTDEEVENYRCMNDALDENYEVHIDNAYPAFDWLNSHHFDYRNLIEKGLALEAPKDMYSMTQ